MRATDFEFRNRFWVIAGLFAAGFLCYAVDHRNAAQLMARLLGHDTRAGVQVAFAVGALLIFVAAWLRTWAAAYLQTAVVKDSALHTERLVADGPYRYLRNPLYLGTWLLSVSFGLMASPTGFVIIAGGLLVFVLRLIGREEAELTRVQGTSYEAYRRAVPSFLPALTARVPASGARPAWRQAVAGEFMMWLFGIGAALFAVTLNQWLLWTFVVLGFLGYFTPNRRKRSTA